MNNSDTVQGNNGTTTTDSVQDQTRSDKGQNALVKGVSSLTAPLVILGAVLAVMWSVEIADSLVHRFGLVSVSTLDAYGIRPRLMGEYWRIAVAPFLHADFSHLIANSIPLVVLGYLIIIRDRWHFTIVFVVSALISGLGVWLLADANTIHIGASGVIFGFMGYLLGRGFFERSLVSILFAFVALITYGSILAGVRPGQQGVSWLGHLFGLLGGVLVAYVINANRQRASKQKAQTDKPVTEQNTNS